MTKLDSNQRFLIPVANINEGTRIRQDYGDVAELASSIATHGLIHPIVINVQGRLIAGGRRLKAMRDILKWPLVPVTYFEFADEATLRILETEENVRRKEMTWQERVLAVAEVHNQRALDAALKSTEWTHKATGELLNMSRANVTYALQLADLIRRNDKDIMEAAQMWDALRILVKRKEEEANKLLAKMTVPKVDVDAAKKYLSEHELPADGDGFFQPVGPATGGVNALADDGEMPGGDQPKITIPLSKMLLRGDCLHLVGSMPDNAVDHIITDPPYGIDMDNLQQANTGMDVSSTAAEHTVVGNEALHEQMIPLFYRVLKPGGFFVQWADAMQWQRLYDLCTKAGFKVQRWPLIWKKTTRCMNQMALYNFTKDYEIAIVARKENAVLLSPQESSVFIGGADAETKELGHPFAKPYKLWQWIYGAVVQRGQTVLDPFAGRGSSTIAALQYGASPIACELNEAHYSGLVVNVSEFYRRTLRNVEFV